MSQEYSLTGIVLSKMTLKETDILFTFLSQEHGKATLIAKGARKAHTKQGAFIQMGAILQINTISSSSDIMTLRNVKSVFIPENLSYADLTLFEDALIFTKKSCKQNQILSSATHELMKFIPIFCHTSKKFLIHFSYKIKLLTQLGFLGPLRECSICRVKLKENEHQFRISLGAVCNTCSQTADIFLSFEELKIFVALQNQPYEFIEKITLPQNLMNALQQKQNTFFQDYT